MTVAANSLPDDPGTLKAMLIAEQAQNDRLRQIIKERPRHRFGRRAETLPEDQMLLGLEMWRRDRCRCGLFSVRREQHLTSATALVLATGTRTFGSGDRATTVLPSVRGDIRLS